jgi:uncharacterized membrane protein
MIDSMSPRSQTPEPRTNLLSGLTVRLPLLFVLFGLLGAIFVALATPPYMAPDELLHANRADLLTLGRVLGERVTIEGRRVAGGPTDRALYQVGAPFQGVARSPQTRADRADYEAARSVRWDGVTGPAAFPGSAIYSPLPYLPQTAAIALGKALRLPVLDTLTLARGANALVSVLVGALAVALAGRIRIVLFALLLLPMSFFLYGTLGQDGVTLSFTALAVALASRAMTQARAMTSREVWAAALCLALVGTAKLPYLVFALLLLAAPVERRRTAYAATAVAVGVTALWWLWSGWALQTPQDIAGAARDPGAQLAYLLGHVGAWPGIAARTFAVHGPLYFPQMVGVLGKLDAPLPEAFYVLASPMLMLAAVLSAGVGRDRTWKPAALAAVGAAVGAAALVFAALYLSWTPLGAPQVDGVQGRYFTPILLVAALALEGDRPWFASPRAWVRELAVAAVAAFPALSLLVAQAAIIGRYYLD